MKGKKQHNIDIGNRIRIAREEAGYTQELFAELIDVSVQYISDLERGVVGTSIPTLMRICTILCVSSDFLLFGNAENEEENLEPPCDFTMHFQNLDEQQQKVIRKSIQVTFEAFHCSDIK